MGTLWAILKFLGLFRINLGGESESQARERLTRERDAAQAERDRLASEAHAAANRQQVEQRLDEIARDRAQVAKPRAGDPLFLLALGLVSLLLQACAPVYVQRDTILPTFTPSVGYLVDRETGSQVPCRYSYCGDGIKVLKAIKADILAGRVDRRRFFSDADYQRSILEAKCKELVGRPR